MIECREGEQLVKSDWISRARVRTRIPTAMLFFCCHKCHTRGKKLSVNCAAKHLFDTFALSSGVVNFVIC